MRIAVVVHPRSSRERLRWDGEELEIWITQPPVDEAANSACVRMVAGWLGVPPSTVRLAAGHRGRRKLVEVEGQPSLPS
ncbi:MAG: DUF167 domain-containing protein [Candidatus Dormiibacterota bacterium]